jgi:hypothetical protein
MQDGVALEERGIPAAVIVTEVFQHEAEVQLAALGMEDLKAVVIDHPLSTLTDGEIAKRAGQALPKVKQVLLGHAAEFPNSL